MRLNKLSRDRRERSRPTNRFTVTAAIALIFSSCGYIGEPMYPLLNIPERVKNLQAVQRGSVIIYQFDLPDLTTEGKQAKIGKVEIRIGDTRQSPFNQEDWYARSVPVEAAPAAGGHVRSEIPVAPWVGKDVILGVKVSGPNGRDAGWSNLVAVTVVRPLDKPSKLELEPVAEGVRVSWQGPPGQYHVFRRAEPDKEFSLVASIEATQWVDTKTEYGKTYDYVVQAATKAGASEAQSELSDRKQVTPVDKYPPAAPAGLNAISAVDHIELIWERNSEADLAGYGLYRAIGDAPLEKIAEVGEAPSYSDRKVESGKQYRYAVSAVDRSGNESKLSEPVEITAP
jgi:hypothetical protein